MIKKILYTLLIIICILSVASCKKEEKEEPANKDYSIHTELQEKYLLGNDYKLATVYAKGAEELSIPKPITLTWIDNGAKSYKITISEEESFDEYKEYSAITNSIDIYNLKIGTTYYWKVSTEEDIKSFNISDVCPRNLYIDGVTNCRDLGGWKIDESHVVKQGMIFRTSKLNEDESSKAIITEKGIQAMLELNIKSEIDLRTIEDNESGGITESLLGKSVTYYACPMESGGNCITLNLDKFAGIFEILGDEKNYPLFFHCSIGTDRTGMLAFLINAVLGVSDDDLYRDYMFSNYGTIGKMRTPTAIANYLDTIKNSEGSTTKEKAYNYLISIGVKKTDLDNMIRILIEEKKA